MVTALPTAGEAWAGCGAREPEVSTTKTPRHQTIAGGRGGSRSRSAGLATGGAAGASRDARDSEERNAKTQRRQAIAATVERFRVSLRLPPAAFLGARGGEGERKRMAVRATLSSTFTECLSSGAGACRASATCHMGETGVRVREYGGNEREEH